MPRDDERKKGTEIKKRKEEKLSSMKNWWIFVLFFRCIGGSIFHIQGSEKVKKVQGDVYKNIRFRGSS